MAGKAQPKDRNVNKKLRETFEQYGIAGAAMARRAELSPNHVYGILREDCDLSSEVLWKILIAMEELAPGSRAYFCKALAEQEIVLAPGESIESVIAKMDVYGIVRLLKLLSDRFSELAFVSEIANMPDHILVGASSK